MCVILCCVCVSVFRGESSGHLEKLIFDPMCKGQEWVQLASHQTSTLLSLVCDVWWISSCARLAFLMAWWKMSGSYSKNIIVVHHLDVYLREMIAVLCKNDYIVMLDSPAHCPNLIGHFVPYVYVRIRCSPRLHSLFKNKVIFKQYFEILVQFQKKKLNVF